MLSRLWREEEGGEEEEDAGSWARSRAGDSGEEISLPCLKSILDEDWYASAASPAVSINAGDTSFAGINPSDASLLLPPPSIDSSSVFPLDHSVHHSFFPSKPALSSLIPSVCSNPFDAGFDFSSDNPAFFHHSSGFAGGVLGFNSAQIGGQDLFPVAANPISFDSFEFSPFLNRGKILRPLEIFPPVGAQPNLFQKRAAAALRLNSAAMGEEKGVDLGLLGQESLEKMRRLEEELDDASIDASGLNYDSEDACDVAAETALKADDEKNEGAGNVSITGVSLSGGRGPKGRKKGLPAKNLMAERRRRKKLNDRLYMLRSVVPKISKMDRASILGDAIEYLKELLQRINDLHNELESTNSALPISNTASFRPLTPTPPALPCRIKEELCPSSLPSPNGQPARVEVRVREGRAVNIHMFCARRPGLLLSTMQALDSLGLDIQQAVISCFNGFALDIFRAEQAKDGPGVLPEEIKEVLLHSAGFQNAV